MTSRRARSGATVLAIALVVGAIGAWAGGAIRALAPAGRADAPGVVDLERVGVYGTVPPFSLIERSGRRVTREDLRGRVWVVNFIYTECTDTCPTQTAEVAGLQQEFRDASELTLVSITVDPAHDTPEVLRRYAERFRASDRWWFLTGPRQEIYCLALDGFRLAVAEPGVTDRPVCSTSASRRLPQQAFRLGPAAAWASHGSKSLVMHSPRVVVVDRWLRIRAYHVATDPDSMTRLRAAVRQLLAERR
jgi:protein SCO1/2